MDQEREMLVMNLIVDAGSAKSSALEAIALAREGKMEEARAALERANEDISRAHGTQTGLIQNEAKGNKTEIDLFMVHAQDHVMTAILAKDLAAEMVELYGKLDS
ncbi:PTS system cellobiose-specific IIA component [Lachnospiraceae bacterium PF1-21]|uniref:PTS lactose/cellobiose transporter subunit IIA n=1 Tax=Ohessyouella blattaphilus TaxID=2949333 RepID=A0ABT1EJJ5_9FIRM|nr:PTS lactose/cellobiose transporter subunit IIA [Ohessyouella blattaphilus]MCP1110858.1 PTS lactose/cellobiose transporter subunit IIA [Ohessyouella blattaphilus]MCR8564252.1 PTS lactose/cellobiose transporter subunit IIA [Ohessyouella blattaphilus]